jgi:DNA-binding NarL/FixJ family response regulator/two-component sensor histidine kinase
MAIRRAIDAGRPEVVQDWTPSGTGRARRHAYAAALPVLRDSGVTGALVIVGDARDPFAALDERFLLALGRQVGAALENIDLYRRLESRTAELERLAKRMVQQHEEERRRLSRELHDETAQLFSAVKLQLGLMREDASAEMVPNLDRALTLMDDGIKSIRDLTNSLRPSLLEDLGLLPALRALVHDFGERSPVAVRFTVADRLPALTPDAELALFRAVQEGLANVGRHAEATTVEVAVAEEEGDLVLRIRDDGRGVAPTGAGSGGGGSDAGRGELVVSEERIRVLVVDDHAVVREGIRGVLASTPEIEVVGEASDGAEALELTEARRPHVVVLDLTMPGMSGLEATAKLRADFDDVRVLILSMHDHPEYVLQAVRAGAHGYVLKDATPEELRTAVRAVYEGEEYIVAAAARQLNVAVGGEQEASAREALVAHWRVGYQSTHSRNTPGQHCPQAGDPLGRRAHAARAGDGTGRGQLASLTSVGLRRDRSVVHLIPPKQPQA